MSLAVPDRKVTGTSGSGLRVRYLPRRKFVVSSRHSPLSALKADTFSESALDGILSGGIEIHAIVHFTNGLPRGTMLMKNCRCNPRLGPANPLDQGRERIQTCAVSKVGDGPETRTT